LAAWRLLLAGGRPFLSLEVTKECPLRCPGCYAFAADHLGGGVNLRDVSDHRGADLVERSLALVDALRPLHVSLIGGEPLVRHAEVGQILRGIAERGLHAQVVTSAVRPIPADWATLPNVQISVSIDGLAPDHDRRRAPATYARILRHIAGHQIVVHCTITRPMLDQPGYFDEFCQFWSARPETKRIWFSLYTPQQDEHSAERLRPAERLAALDEVRALAARYSKVHANRYMLAALERPPATPSECLFARLTHAFTADLETHVEPCQLGGQPMCAECGCLAQAGMTALGRYRLAGLVSLEQLVSLSERLGARKARRAPQETLRPAPTAAPFTIIAPHSSRLAAERIGTTLARMGHTPQHK
jgi:MoaA/NifB/PqqE/SkfB family radical SAM enzyme